jgi:CheY-like chemotaxis protein
MSEVRALIVDDSSVMRKIVERSLRQAGLEFC